MESLEKEKLISIYRLLLDRLPSTYPNSRLIIHKNIKLLRESFISTEGKAQGKGVEAYCDVNNNTIHVTIPFDKESDDNFVWNLLHEIGHLYFAKRYGIEDERWDDHRSSENYANRFADRWIKKLKSEGW